MYCLHKFHFPPSYFLSLDDVERAFIIACIDLKVESEKKKMEEIKSK